MLSTARTFTLDGISARPVRIEVDVHRGLPGFAIVGLPEAAASEARERIRAALVNGGFEFPPQRIVVNLAPASLRKAGPGMDLAIAAALLGASGQLDWPAMERVALAGELALDGEVRPIRGAYAIAEAAREAGVETVVVPAENGPEAALVGGIGVVPASNVAWLPWLAAGEWEREPAPVRLRTDIPGGPDLAHIGGQPHLRQALELTAAGGHSLLMVGPPAAGKAHAARMLPSLLPPLGDAEAPEVWRIASATGRLGSTLPAGRPFRAPHHTISAAGLIGGGTPARPGEVTMAHRGVLFLDELCEFRREVLEALRAPHEAGEVTIQRVGGRLRLPCRFLLVAASNPCPCGRGEDDPACPCRPAQVGRYRGKLSAALADRIDLLAAVPQPSADEIWEAGESSATVRDRVCAARQRQEARMGPGRCNAQMTPAEVRGCAIDPAAAALLADLDARRRLSGRAHDRALRVARTLADLSGAERIGEEEMAQALRLRRRDRV
ncbi:MAG: YifB family Mg chelatase-like AAA ATPase [Actinobacteria bacterium]|nr:YifB family Mg chelatase-like AAA ATPase [Actinomycetota bacterium]